MSRSHFFIFSSWYGNYLLSSNSNVSLYLNDICLNPNLPVMKIITGIETQWTFSIKVTTISENASIVVPPEKMNLTMQRMATVDG